MREELREPRAARRRRWALRARGDGFGVPAAHFWCDTTDRVRLAGTLLGERREGAAVVLAHGFAGYRTKPKIRLLAEELARRYSVLVFDLRGHGQSGGVCSGGQHEMHDVNAVVGYARRRGFDRVVTVGGSLGAIAVLNEAARFRDCDAVVAISAPAVWTVNGSPAVRRAMWLFTSRTGRALSHRLLGTRIRMDWTSPEAPAEVVGRISPIPLLLVHGEDDHWFPVEHARLLYERAGEPKRLLLLPGFGHGEDGFTPAFAGRLADEIAALLALAPA